jgi:hypothetical protein
MGYAGAACPFCAVTLDVRVLVSGRQTCPGCRRGFEAVRFDPPAPDLGIKRLAEAGPEGGQACANHAGNLAPGHCTRCGIFICGLCRIEADAQVLCPACFERLVDEGALPSAVIHYRDYGRMAIVLAVLGLLVIFVGPVAGPGAIYYGVRALRQGEAMRSQESRAGIWAAMVLGGLVTLGGVAVIVSMVR